MSWNKNDKFGLFSLAGTTEIELELDPRYSYKFIHTGDDSSGADDANSALSAFVTTTSGAILADNTVQDDKLFILTDTNETIGPGISKLYVKSATNADAAIQIVRKSAHSEW